MVHVNNTPPLKVAQYLAKEFAKRVDEANRLAKLLAEDVQALRESGYLSLSVDKNYGGQGLPMKNCLAAHLENAI